MRLINSDGQIVDAKVIAKDGGSANSNSIRIDMGPVVLVVCVMLMVVIGACGVVMGLNLSRQKSLEDQSAKTEQEARLVQYYLQDPNSRTPDELSSWARFHDKHAKGK